MFVAQNIKSILQECYGNPEAVTEELVDCILKPGLQVVTYPLSAAPQACKGCFYLFLYVQS